ncbi:MAG: hypothetical protein L0Z07_04110 [Planctomycetes bacterium]|nr:hypothetical protein [Planctomycetota bacterium]
MRLILGIVLFLLGIGSVSCQFEGVTAESPREVHQVKWVRTVDGWERPAEWFPAPVEPPRLHPVVVSLIQGLVSVLALAACDSAPATDRRRTAR